MLPPIARVGATMTAHGAQTAAVAKPNPPPASPPIEENTNPALSSKASSFQF